jgi:hypothetical protein
MLAIVLMIGLSYAMALGEMAGPRHPSDYIIHLFITIPAALFSAFLTRRCGVFFAVLGSIIFSLFIIWFCWDRVADLTRHNMKDHARAWYPIGGVTILCAVAAARWFARSKGEKDKHEAS